MSDQITIKKSSYNKILAAVVVLAIAFSFTAGYVIGGNGKATTNIATGSALTPTQQQPSQAPNAVQFSVPSYAPFSGSNTASVNVIEFGDYQCPFCERFFQQSEPQLKTDYVNTGKVKFYFLDFQFLGPDSQTLGEGAWCADEQGKYYDYHDYIYSHQGQENSGWATPDNVKALAANVQGLDTSKFNSCLDSKKYESRVTELTQLGQKSGVSGTPSFFIGNADKGYSFVVGAQPYSVIKQAIDQKLTG